MYSVLIHFHIKLILDERKEAPYILLPMYQAPC